MFNTLVQNLDADDTDLLSQRRRKKTDLSNIIN